MRQRISTFTQKRNQAITQGFIDAYMLTGNSYKNDNYTGPRPAKVIIVDQTRLKIYLCIGSTRDDFTNRICQKVSLFRRSLLRLPVCLSPKNLRSV